MQGIYAKKFKASALFGVARRACAGVRTRRDGVRGAVGRTRWGRGGARARCGGTARWCAGAVRGAGLGVRQSLRHGFLYTRKAVRCSFARGRRGAAGCDRTKGSGGKFRRFVSLLFNCKRCRAGCHRIACRILDNAAVLVAVAGRRCLNGYARCGVAADV